MRLALLVVASITLAETAHAGLDGFVIPPVEVDIGVGAPVGDSIEWLSPSTEILAGLHWASLAWKPTRFDAGIGYVGSFRSIDRRQLERGRLEADEVRMHGAYLQLGTTLASSEHWRTWFAARGELLRVFDREHGAFSALGTAVRISTELFAQTNSTRRSAAAIGAFALGIYVEVTYREVPGELGPVGFTSGITCRLPLLVVAK